MGETYLVAHGEASVVCRRPPQVCNECNVEQIDQVQPPIQHEPPRLPVLWNEVGLATSGEGKAVNEEEGEDDQDGAKNTPGQFLVHHGLDLLSPLDQLLDGRVEGRQCPNVKCRQGTHQWEDDEEDERADRLRGDGHGGNRIDDTENKVCRREDPDIDHGLAQRWLDDTVSHADYQQEKEGEGIPSRIEDRHNHHENLIHRVITVSVLVVVVPPGHELLDNQEDDGRRNVILDGENVRSVLDIKERPEDAHDRIDNGEAAVEREFCYLRRGKLAIGVPELHHGVVLVIGKGKRRHAIVACAPDRIVDRLGVFEVNRLVVYWVFGLFRCIGRQYKGANVLLFT